MFKSPQKFRLPDNFITSNANNGAFLVKSVKFKRPLRVIASDGGGWEHVSVSLENRCPTWKEMAHIKSLFWGDEDLVIQYHPPEEDYVNVHPFCLHLWRKSGTNDFCERPDKILVG